MMLCIRILLTFIFFLWWVKFVLCTQHALMQILLLKYILRWLILKKNIQECKHTSYSKITVQSASTLMQFRSPMTHLLTYLSYMEKICNSPFPQAYLFYVQSDLANIISILTSPSAMVKTYINFLLEGSLRFSHYLLWK